MTSLSPFVIEMLTRTAANVRYFHKLVGSLERENCRYYEQVLYDNWNNLSRRNGKRTLKLRLADEVACIEGGETHKCDVACAVALMSRKGNRSHQQWCFIIGAELVSRPKGNRCQAEADFSTFSLSHEC